MGFSKSKVVAAILALSFLAIPLASASQISDYGRWAFVFFSYDAQDDAMHVFDRDVSSHEGDWNSISSGYDEDRCNVLVKEKDSPSSENGWISFSGGYEIENGAFSGGYTEEVLEQAGGEADADSAWNKLKNGYLDGNEVNTYCQSTYNRVNTCRSTYVPPDEPLLIGSGENQERKLQGELLCNANEGDGNAQWNECNGDGDTVTTGGETFICDDVSGDTSEWETNDAPYAYFTVEDENGDGINSVNEELTFDPSSSSDDFGIDEYSWDWNGDGSPEDEVGYYPINHEYSSGGSREVTLTVTDDYGKTDTFSRTVSVDDSCLYGADFDPAATELLSNHIDYGDDVTYDIAHNDAGTCPSESEIEFNVCDHAVGEEFVSKTSDKYEINFDVPEDVPCSWGAIFPSDDNTSHRVNITWDDGSNIPHSDSFLNVYAKGEVADPHKGYYIYVEQSVQNDPSNISGMWLTNQTWYDCDGSCGLTTQNTYPDRGSANDRNIPKGAKYLIQQEDKNKADGTQHETGVWHAEYGAIIENRTGAALSNYASEPASSAEGDGNCGGNSECWWLGNNYQNLTEVYEQQFATDLKESFTDAVRVY